jgi:hypothetical protein
MTGDGLSDRLLRLGMWAMLPTALAVAVVLTAAREGPDQALVVGLAAAAAMVVFVAPATWRWLAARRAPGPDRD